MRLINKSTSPKYSSLANVTVQPGRATRELDTFRKTWDTFLKSTGGFDILLDDSDIKLLASLCERFLVPKVEAMSASCDPTLQILADSLRDPGGLKAMASAASARRAAIQKARSDFIRRANEHEARIKAESNEVDALGNPIPKVSTSAARGMGDLKPTVHSKPGIDLKSVYENNLAILRGANGDPIASGHAGIKIVQAVPGGSKIPTNPEYYQNGGK